MINISLLLFQIPQRYRFSSKSQLPVRDVFPAFGCFRYHKGTNFQANHNKYADNDYSLLVVLDTTKVQIFKQITTRLIVSLPLTQLFQIPQRYRFSSKSQQQTTLPSSSRRCFRYHKGTDFQANHNHRGKLYRFALVVLDTTKVQIFKQITTV